MYKSFGGSRCFIDEMFGQHAIETRDHIAGAPPAFPLQERLDITLLGVLSWCTAFSTPIFDYGRGKRDLSHERARKNCRIWRERRGKLRWQKDAPAWATQQRLHSAKPAAAGAYGSPAAVDSSKTSSRAFSVPGAIGQDPAPARNIKVPGAFQNVSEGTDDGPVRTADVQHSLLPDKRGVTGTASAASWSGADGSSSALAPATVETKLRPPSARPFTTLPSSSGATSSNKKRDVFGLMSAPEATSSVPAVAPGLATAEDGGGVNGTLKEMDGQQGRARSTAKKQTGPRRLLVAGKGKQAISAEKQRAALGLDKDKSDDDDAPANDDVARKPCRRKQTPAVSAAVTTVRAASGHDNKTNERMPSSYNSSIKRAPVARVQQDQARGGSHAGIPNVSSLRSSGHTLW